MSIDAPKYADDQLPTDFREAIDGLSLGLYSLDQVRAALAEFLQNDRAALADIKPELDAAHDAGRLNDEEHATLTNDVDKLVNEDAPTEWSKGVDEIVDTQRQAALRALGTADDVIAAAQASAARAPRQESPLSPPEKLQPGVVLRNRFRLEAHIDAGSMGDIFKATDFRKLEADAEDASVAIKVISQRFARFPDALKALQQEAANSQRLSHPNIVRVFDFDRHGDYFYMTMEWLDGDSLVAILNAHRFRPLPFDQGKAIIDGVGQGLIYAHKQGVVHADIKPGNIFVTDHGDVKLLDFGIARAGHTAPGGFDPAVIGAHTPAYSSCEVLEGQTPTAQDDVYSLACIAYRIFAGRRAFSGFTALESESHGREPKPIDTLSPEQWEALHRAMAYRRADRTPDVATFLDEFTRAPRAAERESAYDTLIQESAPATKNRLPMIVGATALVGVAAIVAAILLQQNETPTAGVSDPPAAAAPTLAADNATPVTPTMSAENGVTDTAFAGGDESALALETAPVEGTAPATLGTADIETWTALAQQRMDEGLLVTPTDDSAIDYLNLIRTADVDSAAYRRGANRLANLMMLEAMIAINERRFDLADTWIDRADALGAEIDVTTRVARELDKARAAEAQRVSEAERIAEAERVAAEAREIAEAAAAAQLAREQAEIEAAELAAVSSPDESAGAPADVVAPAADAEVALRVDQVVANETAVDGAGETADLPVEPQTPAPPPAPTIESALAARVIEIPDTPPTTALNRDDEVPLSSLEFTRFVEPRYPRTLSADQSGWVEVRFRVNERGNVDDVNVVSSDPPGFFEDAALRAVTRWRFEPNVVNGRPTPTYSGVRLRFEGSD